MTKFLWPIVPQTSQYSVHFV